MGKLSRFTQLLFGSMAGANQIAQFGSLAGDLPATYSGSTITPALVQGFSSGESFLEGWEAAIEAGNSPAIEDMNALFYNVFYQLCSIFQDGIPQYDSGTTYFAGSVVNYNDAQYICFNDNSDAGISGETPTNGTYWTALGGVVQTKSTAYAMLATDKMVVISGGYAVTLPDATTVLGRDFEIVNADGSANTVATLSDQTISGQNCTTSPYALSQQYQFLKVRSDGSNYWIISAG